MNFSVSFFWDDIASSLFEEHSKLSYVFTSDCLREHGEFSVVFVANSWEEHSDSNWAELNESVKIIKCFIYYYYCKFIVHMMDLDIKTQNT